MKRIAVITAPNMRYVNTGMTTVELSAKGFFSRLVPDANIKFYSVVEPNPSSSVKWMMMDLGYAHPSSEGVSKLFQHLPLADYISDAFASDLIIYWGDFLQARHYIENEGAQRLAALHGLEHEDAKRLSYQMLLQTEEFDSVKEKSIIFGSSLLYNTARDYSSGSYARDLSDFGKRCAAVLMRDPISAMRITHLTGKYNSNHLGIDPAFLMRESDTDQLPVSKWSGELEERSAIGLFFGTRTKPPALLWEFCVELAESFGLNLEWLPWFPYHEILRIEHKGFTWKKKKDKGREWRRRIEELLPRGDEYTQGDLLAAIKKYRFVISDTYHLCINSWRAGIPAICFGSESMAGSHVIRDFKKRILYEMYDAKDFYFDALELSDKTRMQAVVRNLVPLLDSAKEAEMVRERVRMHGEFVGEQLAKAIGGVLKSNGDLESAVCSEQEGSASG